MWDPERELLPYEEVAEVDEPVVQGHAWLWWVGGALLLVGVAMVLMRVLATDDPDVGSDADDRADESAAGAAEPGTDDPTGGGDDTGEDAGEDTPAGEARELAGSLTFGVPATAPPTRDFDGNLVGYDAAQMGDGVAATAWRMDGDATGQTITMTLPDPAVVESVGLVNGYAKQVAGVDWYPNNRRVVAVTWTFSDGSEVTQTLAEQPEVQTIEVPPVETASLTLTLTSVTPPGGGSLGRDYTAISEVTVIGRPAG